jgi:CBS domain containing-hemolysin-like protein
MQAEMSIAWWPALVFGWPGPILAVIFCVVGIVRAQVAWLIAAAIVLMPFSLYLGLNPRVQWGVVLPVFPLIAAGAIARGSKPIAWLSLLLLTGVILWLASIVFGEKLPSRVSIAHGRQSAVLVWPGTRMLATRSR